MVTGLVILSQEGSLVQKIISPKTKNAMGKVYEVEALNPYTGKEAEIFASGDILLKGKKILKIILNC